MRKVITINIGDRFGRLLVKGIAERRNYYLCLCDCGATVLLRKDALYTGNQVSCGCYHREATRNRTRTHGMGGPIRSPEYDAWAHMLSRCCTSTTAYFHNYGGRGIKVCNRWRHSFENFLADMGNRPSPQHSIDRIDNDGNYEPGNCRWATRVIQMSNTRRNKFVTYQGRTMTVSAWTRELGFPREVLRRRIADGWPIERALTTPVGRGRSRGTRQPQRVTIQRRKKAA